MTDPRPLRLRRIAPAEYGEFYAATERAFASDVHPDDEAAEKAIVEFDRTTAAFADGELVGTAAVVSLEMTLPGAGTAAPQPVAGVTHVGVLPTYRRRGVLRAMLTEQLRDLHEGGEPVAALFASESAIYGRFGYGLASFGLSWRVERSLVGLRPEAPTTGGRVRLAAPADVRQDMVALHDAVRRRTVGHFARADPRWDWRLSDPERRRDGASALTCALVEVAGEVQAYALYRTKRSWDGPLADGTVQLQELFALEPAAEVDLWRFLLGIDLMTTVELWHRPMDDPLMHLLSDPRRGRPAITDGLWVRIVDIGRGLASRGYASDVDLVLEVSDAVCAWNSGRWQLEAGPDGASCSRTDRAPDLSLDVRDLGAGFLGGVPFSALARGGLVVEHRAGAVRAATAAFANDHPPHCPEIF